MFCKASEDAGKDQYLVPYFISGHPGSTLKDSIDLALYLKGKNLRPRQVQDFIPTPMAIATTMFYTEKPRPAHDEAGPHRNRPAREAHDEGAPLLVGREPLAARA